MNEKRIFFNNLSYKWDDIIKKFDFDDYIKNLTKLNIKQDDIILDVGSGTGILYEYLTFIKKNSRNIIFSDFSEKMLSKLKTKYNHNSVCCYDNHFIPFKDNSFNKIVCFSAFPHFDNKKQVLKEFYRIIKNNGFGMILHFDSSDNLNNMHCKLNTPVNNDKLPKINKLNEMINETGFNVIESHETDTLYYSLWTCSKSNS